MLFLTTAESVDIALGPSKGPPKAHSRLRQNRRNLGTNSPFAGIQRACGHGTTIGRSGSPFGSSGGMILGASVRRMRSAGGHSRHGARSSTRRPTQSYNSKVECTSMHLCDFRCSLWGFGPSYLPPEILAECGRRRPFGTFRALPPIQTSLKYV